MRLVLFFLSLFLAVTSASASLEEWKNWWYNWHFWEDMQGIESNVAKYIADQTAELVEMTNAGQIGVITNGMADAVEGAQFFIAYLSDHNVDTNGDFKSKLEAALNPLFHQVQAQLSGEDITTNHEVRATHIAHILEETGNVIVHVCDGFGLPDDEVRPHWERITPHAQRAIEATADFVEQHPKLVETALFVVTGLLLGDVLILRVALSLFGFGPWGPVKGSAASAAQRYFFGGAIPAGSWYSSLQRAGATQGWVPTILSSAFRFLRRIFKL